MARGHTRGGLRRSRWPLPVGRWWRGPTIPGEALCRLLVGDATLVETSAGPAPGGIDMVSSAGMRPFDWSGTDNLADRSSAHGGAQRGQRRRGGGARSRLAVPDEAIVRGCLICRSAAALSVPWRVARRGRLRGLRAPAGRDQGDHRRDAKPPGTKRITIVFSLTASLAHWPSSTSSLQPSTVRATSS